MWVEVLSKTFVQDVATVSIVTNSTNPCKLITVPQLLHRVYQSQFAPCLVLFAGIYPNPATKSHLQSIIYTKKVK